MTGPKTKIDRCQKKPVEITDYEHFSIFSSHSQMAFEIALVFLFENVILAGNTFLSSQLIR